MNVNRTRRGGEADVIEKIISGGQTGVDRGALDAALAAGFPCGGSVPAGRKAEDGRVPGCYPLTELRSPRYHDRTLRNVLDADATLIVHHGPVTGGTRLTLDYCVREGKPYRQIDAAKTTRQEAAAALSSFVEQAGVRVLNVAGPRERSWPGAQAYTRSVVGLYLHSRVTDR
jgi:hypothetical protein